MMSSESDPGNLSPAASFRGSTRWETWVSIPVLLWIIVLSTFFYIRFSFVFYGAHREAIEALFRRLLEG